MEQTTHHNTILALSPLDDALAVGLPYGEEAISPDDTEEPSTPSAASTRRMKTYTPRDDDTLERYFDELRQYPLLKPAEESALWQRIERLKDRGRRALYISPTALPTLLRLWNQVKHGEIPWQDIFHQDDADLQELAIGQAHLEEMIVQLQELATGFAANGHRRQLSRPDVRERLESRKVRADHWHQWLEAWQRLPLHPQVHEMLRLDLESASVDCPQHRALRAALTAWRRTQRHLEDAKAQMMRANLRLVIHFALPFRDRGVPLPDLIQEGNLGLIRAIDKFEPERGHRFATYAYWWIRQGISRALIEQGRTVRLPSHVAERQNKLRVAVERLWKRSGQSPSIQEVSQALGWTPHEVEALRTASQPIMSLQQLLPEGDQEVGDLFEDTNVPKPEVTAEHAQLKHYLDDCLGQLKPREALVLRRHYGLETGRPETLQDIGDALGLSRERIRQIEKAALEHLRASRNALSLEEFVKVD